MSRFENVSPKTVPLYRDSRDGSLLPVSLKEEREVALYGSNSIVKAKPGGSPGLRITGTEDWREVSTPFNNSSDTIISITHAVNPNTENVNWFAVVRPGTGDKDQIWRSDNRLDWLQCAISSGPSSFRLNGIRSSVLSDSNYVRSGGYPVIAAVGQSGSTPLILKSTNLDTFEISSLPAGVEGPLHDIAYGNGVWLAVGSNSEIILKNSGIDLSSVDWEEIPSTIEELGSIAYGNGTWVATNFPGEASETLRTGMNYSTDNGSTWTPVTTPNISVGVRKVRYTGSKWAAVGYKFNLLGTNTWNSKIYLSDDAITWTEPSIAGNKLGTQFTDIDWGVEKWVVSSTGDEEGYWYANTLDAVQFFKAEIISSFQLLGSGIEFSGGLNGEWLLPLRRGGGLFTVGGHPSYNQSIEHDSDPNSVYIGSYINTYLDTNNSLQSEETQLFQYKQDPSDLNYKDMFGSSSDVTEKNQPIYLGADSSGDIWEMDSNSTLTLASRLATYHYGLELPGTFRLERNRDIDSENWHVWHSDIFTDIKNPITIDKYSIIRRNYDADFATTDKYESLLKMVGPDPLPDVHLNPNGRLGLQEMGSPAEDVSRKLINLASKEFGIGDMLLINDSDINPTYPPYNETGGWLKRGSARDVRETGPGKNNYEVYNSYTLWCRVTVDSVGDDLYVDSNYFTPEGESDGYVFP